jgi:hypothetical protein
MIAMMVEQQYSALLTDVINYFPQEEWSADA